SFLPTVFQNFEAKTDSKDVAPRVAALRKELTAAGLDGFLIPRADAHRGESVPPGEARLAYVTAFTGSAGVAIVGRSKAALFVDSRYAIQAPEETDQRVFRVQVVAQAALPAEIGGYVPRGGRIGYDPWLHTPGEIKDLTQRLAGRAELVPSANLVDRIWPDRPPAPVSPVEFLGHNRAGRSSDDKLTDLRRTLGEEGADAVVLTLPESICWLLNMRGRDVPNTPFVLGFAIVPRRGLPTLFVDKAKLTEELRRGLDGIARVADATRLLPALQKLGAPGKRVMLDPATCPIALVEAVKAGGDAVVIEKRDPVLLPKAKKNEVEISGMREAQSLDSVAMAKFLCWYDAEAPKGEL